MPLPRTSSVFLQVVACWWPAGGLLVACRMVELQQKLRGCSGQWKDSFGQTPSSLWSGHILSTHPSTMVSGRGLVSHIKPVLSEAILGSSQNGLSASYIHGEANTFQIPLWRVGYCSRPLASLLLCEATAVLQQYPSTPALRRHMSSKPGVHICWGRGLLWY